MKKYESCLFTILFVIFLFLFLYLINIYSMPVSHRSGSIMDTTPTSPNTSPIVDIPDNSLELAVARVKRFRKGQIAFNAPEKMSIGDTTEIEVKITDDLKRVLRMEKYIKRVVERDEIDIYQFMTADLTGIGFNIKPLQENDTFLVLPGKVVSWRWEIAPIKSGKQRLYLRINAKLKLDDFETTYTLQKFERKIEVKVNPQKWFQSNWFKIIELLVVIFGGGIVAFIASKLPAIKRTAKKIKFWIKKIYKKLKS